MDFSSAYAYIKHDFINTKSSYCNQFLCIQPAKNRNITLKVSNTAEAAGFSLVSYWINWIIADVKMIPLSKT